MCNLLLGAAIGDALGVPFESCLSNNKELIAWDCSSYIGSAYHQLSPGQYSDDTIMQICVAESLIENSGFNPDHLSKKYVDVITSNPNRGYGGTTKLAISSLANNKHWSESGVNGSFGNGTAMRAPPFGIYFRNDLKSLIPAVKIDSAITHVSDDAEAGALAIAIAAYYAVNKDVSNLVDKICEFLPDCKTKSNIQKIKDLNIKKSNPILVFKALGTSANVSESVPSTLYAFLKFDNYMDGVIAIIKAGRDTDSNACMLGSLFAARDGCSSIPSHLINDVEDRDKLIKLDSLLYSELPPPKGGGFERSPSSPD
jgi:ADP-ribosyl-[dinitrogen reductase] hydrolase